MMVKGWGLIGAFAALLGYVAQAGNSGTSLPPEMSFKDVSGRHWSLSEAVGSKATVIAFTGSTCPLCKKYGPTLARLEDAYQAKGVKFVYVNPTESESLAQVLGDGKRLGLNCPYVKDDLFVEPLNAKSTTEVFVLDPQNAVVYRGAVDDQYGLNYSIEKPRKTYLVDALNSVLAGKRPRVAETEAPGCVLKSAHEETVPLNYASRIAPMIEKNCVECHRDGGVAPFSLERYEDVKARGPMLKFAVQKGLMPPWFAAKQSPSPWKNDRSLSDRDKQDLADWVDSGMPAGDLSSVPKRQLERSSWAIGKPDATFRIPRPVDVKETGIMPYQVQTVETTFTEDKWVEAMEVQPSQRSVVHHVLIFVKQKGGAQLGDLGEELSGFFAAYVPGNDHIIYPKGFGKRLPAGASLKFQIHYTPNGSATTDQTQLGLRFAKSPIQHEVQTIGIANLGIRIPPGADNHKEVAQIPVPFDVKVMSYIPHLHVRGKAVRYDLIKPDGSRSTLLDVPRYDFNWQLSYEYAEPLDVPKGSRVEFAAWFDNSDKNPANPDPKKTVRWGAQTYDEMHLGYVEYYVPGQEPGKGSGNLRPRVGSSIVVGIFGALDRDKDGFVTQGEAGRAWDRIKEADANGDGKVSLEEAKAQFGG